MKHENHYFRLLCMVVLLWLAPALSVMAQDTMVKGTVIDGSGEPVIGASVVDVATKKGTVTDLNGNFSVSTSARAQLRFSYVGYTSQTVSVNGRKTINVTLREDQKVLSDLVVVGYGQMKRSDLTGSVVSVNDKAIERSVPTSIDQVLQGRAAGVQIQANSGTPGANTSIHIRGINSLNATNQPIFVIDGVVVEPGGVDTSDPLSSNNPLASINPSDIVSMDVLKDASATAIYGSRASNGVIMITTKRGKAGEATITYDGYVGWQEQAKKLDMMNLQEYANHHNARANAGIVASSDAFVNVDALGDGTDWQEALFRRALMTSHNLSITGGTQASTYAISGGYLNQKGIAVGSGYKRLTLRGNTDAQVKKWLKAAISFSLTDSKQEVGANNNLIMNALESQPSVAVKSADGSYDGPDDVWMPVNAIALANMRENFNKKMNFRVSGSLEATLMKGLTLKTELSADYNLNKYYYYEPDYKFGVLTNSTRTGKWTKTDTKYWSWRNILTYANTFDDVHTVNLMLGQEMSHSHWESQASTATGFLSNSVHDISAGDVSSSTGTGTQVNNSLFSYFGRAFYSYADRYLVTATLRNDGSSHFAKGHRWGWFPSAALAWKVSNEPFMKNTSDIINNLKFRFGWGSTGNQNLTDWAYMALLSSKSTPWGTGVITANNANPDLKWETTDSYNLGLDLGLFHNRIEFIFDWYYKKTRDLLLQIPLPAYLGSSGNGAASNPWANVGSLRNTGIEMTLNTVNIDKHGFQWRTNLVFSLNRNKVISLDTESSTIDKTFQVGSDVSTVTRTTVGHPIGQFWGYKVIGRFDKAEDFYYKDAEGNVKAVALPEGSSIAKDKTWIGDYIFEDINKDGKINNEDETFIGNPLPDFTYGIGNTFSWKGFDLTVFFSGSYGNDVINYNRRFLEDVRSNSNLLRSAANYAQLGVINSNLPNDDYRNLYVVNASSTVLPRLSASSTNANNRMSDMYVEDGSYIRLQNVSLSYTLPKAIVRKIKLENVKVYMNMQNVFTWSKYNGFDPEVGAMYGDALMTGLDYGRYPSPRIYTFGLNVSF
jgi:TonB-linked SusC/RagA family outer membrane protein